ncbi:MAG TPA: RNA polymerase sigma-70 factor [Cyclobacteriaceae bacterium]|nr:RNA polymerase sigma-70 factor [Cyclobacteriaceae bacterium]
MKLISAYTDAKLFYLIKKGDKDAFDCLYRKYWPLLLDQAYKRLKCKEEAEEIVQELFINLWINRQKIHLTHSFSTYIATALRYKVYNCIRRNIIRENYMEAIVQREPPFSETVQESVLFNDLHDAYQREIENLPEKCRKVYTLRRHENLSFKEIAEKLDISVNTVDKQLVKALKRLRERLKDYHSSIPFFCFYLLTAAYVFLIGK